PRNPADENQRLLRTVGDDLAEMNHYCFKGRQSFQNHFRCLVAGGGTGDAAIFLAEQLRGTNAEIVYLDMSEASRRIAEQRAQTRGLENIQWVTASLLDIPKLGLGTFDYVNCSGVLHHLPEPKEGLQSLASVLREGGALFLMLYGRYGRRGVYDMQEVFQMLLPETMAAQEKIDAARAVLAQLPPTNYFQRNRGLWESEIGAGGYGDAGLYDLLLHSQDRAYDVDAIYDLLEAGGLELIDFTGSQKRSHDLKKLVSHPSIARLCENLDRRQKFSVAEKLSGDIIKHSFYAARSADRAARIEDYVDNPDLCIVLAAEMKGMHDKIHQAIVPGEKLSITYTVGDRKEIFQLPGNAINKRLFKYFDGATPLAKMIGKVKLTTGGNPQAVRAEIEKAFELLHSVGWAYLCNRSPSTNP
ncbi:MAG: class I SAM-dependent methyltransferase, partial [Burkholderiales bacterium]